MDLNENYTRNSFTSRRRLNSNSNVTPFIDVMLVLLVIFMVTSPMMISGIEVDLPKTVSAPLSSKEEPLVLTIDKLNKIYIQENEIDSRLLAVKLTAILQTKPETRIFVKGDKNVHYGEVMQLVTIEKNAGLKNVALITEIDQG